MLYEKPNLRLFLFSFFFDVRWDKKGILGCDCLTEVNTFTDLSLVYVAGNISELRCVEKDRDFSGNEIQSGVANIDNVASWEDCQKHCQKEQECMFWTFRQSSGTCMLQTSDSGRQRRAGFKSGPKKCPGMRTNIQGVD